MHYECIHPGMRDGICEMMEASIEEIAAFDLGGPGTYGRPGGIGTVVPHVGMSFPVCLSFWNRPGEKWNKYTQRHWA